MLTVDFFFCTIEVLYFILRLCAYEPQEHCPGSTGATDFVSKDLGAALEILGTLTFSVVTFSFSNAFDPFDDLVEATLAVFGTLAVTVSFKEAEDPFLADLVEAELAVF